MDKLIELISRCKCEVTVTANEHRTSYVKLEEWLADSEKHGGLEINPSIRQKMVETDTMINIQFYPDTPVGFYDIYHYDLDAALDQALSCFST